MTVINAALERRLKATIKRSFKIAYQTENRISFTSKTAEKDVFFIYCELLSENEILKLAKILAEAYRGIRNGSRVSEYEEDTLSERNLNRNSEFSSEFVRSVIDLESSDLHKLLLLTSGNQLISNKNLDLMINLANSKKEDDFSPTNVLNSKHIYNHLKNLYILPGVSARTAMSGDEAFGRYWDLTNGIECGVRVMAFLSERSESRTLQEQLDLDFVEATTTQKFLLSTENVSTIQLILRSKYRELAESMTAAELIPLSHLFGNLILNLKFPEDILRNRSKAMSYSEAKNFNKLSQTVKGYLSDTEMASVSSPNFITRLDALLNDSEVVRVKNPPLIYAALAEVLVVKGEGKAFEVALELQYLSFITSMSHKIYEATVSLIAEALKTESDEMPFSWFAQMSKHSWVLTSHAPEKELSLLV